MKLHVWGPLDGLHSVSAECLAAIWYLHLTLGHANEKTPSQKVQVVQSSNVYLSPAHVLPALQLDDGNIVSGYFAIVRSLKSLGYNLDSTFTSRELADVAALSSFISSEVAPISTYMLYMVKPNFEQIIRPAFSSWVQFPMYYSLALDQQDIAFSQCELAGLNTSAARAALAGDSGTHPKVSDPTLGKILQKAEKHAELLEQTKTSMHLLTRSKAVYDTITNMATSQSLPSCSSSPSSVATPTSPSSPSYLFGERISSADLLLMGHLALQTWHGLPAPILTSLIQTYPLLNQLLSSCTQLQTLEQLDIRPPCPPEALTPTFWLKYKLGFN